jgi:hypothetical protein
MILSSWSCYNINLYLLVQLLALFNCELIFNNVSLLNQYCLGWNPCIFVGEVNLVVRFGCKKEFKFFKVKS